MLGRLEMSVQECIDHYEADMITIFGKQQRESLVHKGIRTLEEDANLIAMGRTYNAKPLEDIVKELVSKKLKNETEKEKLLDDSKKCKVYEASHTRTHPLTFPPRFVMAFDKEKPNNTGPVYLRSYTSQEIFLSNIKIWEAARATSAAPMYFDPMKVVDTASEDKTVYQLIDGGLGANNPLGWLVTANTFCGLK